MLRYFFKSPIAGAQTTLRLALDPALEKSSGGYYFDTIKCPVLPKAKNKEMADYLWKVSEEMVGLRPKEQMTVVPVTLHVPPKPETNGHTTVIDVETIPSNNEMPDNKKMEESIIKSNGTSEKSEKMKKMSESEKQDEPEKTDKPEKTEKIEIPKNDHKEIDDSKLSENNDTQEKFEKMHISKTNGELSRDVVSEDIPDGVEMEPEKPARQSSMAEKKNPMENINAIEKASDVIEKEVSETAKNTVENDASREKAI